MAAKDFADHECSTTEGSRRVIGERANLRINLRDADAFTEGRSITPKPPPPPPRKRSGIKRGRALNLLTSL